MVMKSVGQLLRETRESKGFTTKQVSSSIKIRESLIEALEKNEYYIFSSDMHLKSFLKAYASFLGINEDKILALYRRDRQIKLEDGDKRQEKTQSNKSFNVIISKFINLKGLYSLLGVFVLILIVLFFYNQIKAYYRPPFLEIVKPQQNEVFETDSFVIEGLTEDPSVKVFVDSAQATYIDSEGRFRVNAKFNEPGLKRFIIYAENQFGKKTEKTLDLTYSPKQQTSPTPTPEASTSPRIRIRNISTKNYNLSFIKDNNSTQETITIVANSSMTIDYRDKLLIKNYDKTALELYFDDDNTPTTSIDSREFSIIIENNRPIIKNK